MTQNDKYTETDKEALNRALNGALRNHNPLFAELIQSMLAAGENFYKVAELCSFRLQKYALRLSPEQIPPCHIDPKDIEDLMFSPAIFGGVNYAARIAKGLLDRGLSIFEPDPLRSLEYGRLN